MPSPRRATRPVRVRDLVIGGDSPVSIQSMTCLPLEDVAGTIAQIERLRAEGADLVRLAVRNEDSVRHLREVRRAVDMPLSADVHFSHRVAIAAIEAGIDKIRINPGNIGDEAAVRDVVRAAAERGVPIRVGVNAGSLDKRKYPIPDPESLVDSAADHLRILEEKGFSDIVVSIKSSDIFQTIEANRLYASRFDYPLHIGLTEAGYGTACVVRSSIAIGHLLLEGIGDTVRVSMTGDPVEEVTVAKRILEAAGRRRAIVRMISCPTCGRTDPAFDVLAIARELEAAAVERYGARLDGMGRTLTLAVMGCEVNGPGEAAHADVGVAGGKGGRVLLFSGGKRLRAIAREAVLREFLLEIEKLLEGGGDGAARG